MFTILVLFFFRLINLMMSIIIFIFILNFFTKVLYQRVYLVIIFRKKYHDPIQAFRVFQCPFASYYCGFKASDIGACFYKICDDSVRSRHFLGADNTDEIEVILSDREDHFLHKFIDGNEPL